MPLFLNILWRETQNDPTLRQRAFAGLRRYQEAVRPAPPPAAPCFARAGNARLLQYGVDNGRAPVVFLPSLINPPQVLDLSQGRSLLRHMAAAGHDAFLVDWGAPSSNDAAMDLGGHVTQRLLPMLEALPRQPILVGYCLGGTLALAASMLRNVAAVATIATPWDFNGYPDEARAEIAALWTRAKPLCERLGYVPMEVLQSGFWAMDPARTIAKYAAFADMEAGSDAERAFMAVEDWANGGPPLTYAAGSDLFDNLYAGNVSGWGAWTIDGIAMRPEDMECPSLSIASATDRIVPAAAAPLLRDREITSLGHVGMIVSGRAPELLWHRLSDWVSTHGG